MDDDSSYLVITAALLLLAAVTAVFGQALQVLSFTRLNAFLKRRTRPLLSESESAVLEHSRSFLTVLQQLLRFGAIACVTAAAVRGSYSVLGVAAAYGVVLVACLVLLELIPRAVARTSPERIVASAVGALRFGGRLFAPIGYLYEALERFFVRAGGGDVQRQAEQQVEDELLSAAEEGEREGVLERGGRQMIESIISFYDVEVREVMTPRTSMVCLDSELSLPQAVRTATACGHSRIPVYRENKDNIVGILYVKDLLRYVGSKEWQEKKVGQIVRKAYFVPESKKVSRLFQEFRSQRFHIAVVLDEYGGTCGLVTIEDILEEIVGEIADEYELQKSAVHLRRVDERTFEADALVHIDELNEGLGLDLPEDDSYETLAGFLFTRWGRIPQIGERITHAGATFEVMEADERRIKRVRIFRENGL